MRACPLRLGDLLGDPDLGIALVTGDPADYWERPIVGAHVTELPRPRRWLSPGWLVCTTGLVFVDSPERQREFVRDLCDAGAAALAFGIGVVTDAVPLALLDEARTRRLPVVTIAEQVRFHDVVARVGDAHRSPGAQREQAVQRYLFEAVTADDPTHELLERVSRVSASTAAIVDASGAVTVVAGSIAADRLRAALAAEPALASVSEARPIELPQQDGYAALAIAVGGASAERLVVVRHASAPHAVAWITLPVARTVLQSIRSLEQARRRHDRAGRAAVLGELQAASDPVTRRIASEQAASLGVRFRDLPVVIAVEPREDDDDRAAVLEALQEQCEAGLAAYLATETQRGAWALVVATADDAHGMAEALARAGDLLVGVGCPVAASADLRGSLLDAQVEIDRQRVAGSVAGERNACGGSLTTLLLSTADHRPLGEHVDGLFAPLADHDALLETLATYFASNMNVAVTATRLHIHANSLRYRLTRIEELLGHSLRDPAAIADIYVGLRVRALGAPPEHPCRQPDGMDRPAVIRTK